ncbi:T9SS type A sorting domain-containing protein [Pontibacter sp. Tf4]|uniref:T9SS type A sorting domain-containing protein n=1 Tax=Pontibacter sp. Tf4 TaxID=2761620 RepID=UPI001628F7F3|nr:T9SS type A sorting domain-containing protein [Pontibacter sp. Tf4]MBB6612206.1 T9SS type A sorting domain-containing protein [Pontibacter sp. Tf4]
MKKSFTHLISEIRNTNRFTVGIATLFLIIISAAYLKAAVGVTTTGNSTMSISADLAANATLTTPTYTSVGIITIAEANANDFASSGNIVLIAPAGWRFRTSAVNAPVTLNNDTGTPNISTGNATFGPNGTTITIPLSVNNTNKKERIDIEGVAIQALDGANLPATGSIMIGVANGAVVSGLPTVLSQTISQVVGAPRKLAFISQPSNTDTDTPIPSFQAAIQDQFGTRVTTANNTVALAIGNNPVSGSLTGGTATTANGVVTFSGYRIDAAGTGYTLTASGSGLTSATSNAFNINSKTPTLAALPANCVTQGANGFTLTVTGTNFERGSVVRVDGASRTTTYISSTQLQVAIPASDLVLAGNRIITVLNPAPPSNNISNSQTLVVNPAMSAATIVGERQVCAGKDVIYEAPSGFTNYSWSVTQGAGVLTPTANPAIVRFEPEVPASGKVTISVAASNACNARSTASFDVTVLPTPIAVIAYDSPAICEGSSQVLSVATAPAGDVYTYQWFRGTTVGGATSPVGTNSPTLTVTTAGVYTVTVTGQNNCPRTSDPVEIKVNPLPTATITTSGPTTFCEGGQVTLTAEGGTSFLWSNGSTNKSITVDASGTYTVQVTDANSCTSAPSAPVTVTENPKPVATITPNGPTTFCQGGSVTLTASAGASWLWSNGATTQSISVNESGTFTVVVTDANGCSSVESVPVNVTVNPLPVASIQAGGPTTFCEGGTVTLTAQGGTSWLWSNGATTQSIVVNAGGNYSVQVTDGNSCTSAPSDPVSVTVNPLPTVSITPTGPLQFCEGNSVVLVPTALPNTDTFTYQWFDAANNSEVSTDRDYVATTSGDYYLVVTNQNGCQQTSETLTVIVAELPTEANITLTGTSTFCQGGNVKLSANKSPDSENPYTYKWFKNDVEIPNETSETYIANESGDYQVEVTNLVEDCSKLSAKVKITVLPQPVATITSSSEQKCIGAGNTTTFSVTGDFSGGTAQWLSSNPAFVISNPVYDATTGKATATVTATGSGTSNITLRTTNSATSCTTANSTVALTVNPLPSATITAGGPTTFCKGSSVVLSAPQGTGYTYRWLNGTEEVGTGQQYTATETGNYTVEVTNSATGCFTETSSATSVTVLPQPVASITGDNQAKCIGAGNTTSFSVSGTFSGGTAQWISSNTSFQIQNPVYDTSSGQASATIVATGTGTATITLRTTNAASACTTANSTITLTVNPRPSATITAGSPTTFCQGGSVVLSAPQGNYSYQWFNGTTAIGGATNQQYTASTAGSYTVRVTDNITQCEFRTAAATVVTVNPQPVVTAASASPAAKCVGTNNLTVFDLTGAVTNGNPLWTVAGTTGSATVSNISSPNTTSTQVTVSGVGTVTMRLSSSSTVASCNTASRDVTLTIYPMPIANAGADQEQCQAASGVTFFTRDGSGSGGGTDQTLDVKWTEKSRDAGITAVSIGYDWQYKQRVDITGIGSVTLTMTVTTNGCSTSDEVTYTVKPRPVVSAISNQTYCNGTAVPATTLRSDIEGATYSWTSSTNVGFGTSGTGNIPAFTATNTSGAPISTTVRVTATAGECAGTVSTFTITVNPTPRLTNIPSNAPQICSESVFNYSPAVSPSGATTSWSRAAIAGISNPAATGTGSISETLVNTTNSAITVNYVYTVTANGCSNTQTVPVVVNPKPTITSFSLGTDNDSDGDGKFADVYTGQAALPLAGTPSGGTFRINGATATSFNPCTIGPGTHTITYTRTQGSCTTVVSKTVTVRQSTYRAVITANPHPFCRGGGGTTYTAAIYRDVQPGEIIYPYLVDADGNPVDAAGNPIPKGGGSYPVPNMAYPFPANTPQSIKEMAYRFFQPIVSPALEARKIAPGSFTYQWGKNDEVNRKNDAYIISDAGLSSQDYYEVEVRSSNLCGPVSIESNRMYSAVLDNYVINITASPNPICQGGAVTFTGTLGAGFPWAIANLQLQVVLIRTNTVLYSSGYTGNTFTFTTDAASVGGFINGDRVEVKFTSNITGYLPSSNCIEGPSANSVIVNVNDIVAGTPTDQSQTICLNGSATFNAPVTTTGPTTVNYTWNVGGMTYTTTVPTLTVSAPRTATAGTYPVSVVVANSCETTTTLPLGTLTVKPALTVFNLTGNAEYCAGATGTFPLILSGSQAGVNYTLMNGATTVQTIAGTGSPLTFTVPKVATTYTVVAAYATTPACSTNMSGSAVIKQNALPTVTVNSPTVCAGQTATVTATPAGGTGPYTYTWTVPAEWTGSVPTTASFQTLVPGTYTVRVTDSKSCVSSAAATSTVTVNPLPTVTVNSPTTCQGSTITVAATVDGGAGPYNYTWTVPSGWTGPLPTTASFQTSVGGTYTVVVTDARGCASASGSGTVTITPTQVATGVVKAENANGPISETNPIKVNEPVTFVTTTDIPTADIRFYTWYIGSLATNEWGESVATTQGNSYTMTPTTDAVFDVKVVVTTALEACYSFTQFFTDEPITPLPVELTYFKAVRSGTAVVLTWETASEKDNKGFEVQVSQDGKSYRQLQFVPSKNGTSSLKQKYEFVDKENGKHGTRHYRLRQLDLDGKYTYYGPVAVAFGEAVNKVLVYPNPFEREVKLEVDAEKSTTMEVTLTNIMGRQLLVKHINVEQGKNTTTLDLGADLPAGVYIITTRYNGTTNSFKLFKQ